MLRNPNTYVIAFFLILFSGGARMANAQAPYTWLPQQRITSNNLLSIYFTDSLTGWVGGNNGVIYNTTDGGKNWKSQTSGITSPIIEIYMLNQNLGWMIGEQILTVPNGWYGSYLLHTTDGGANWSSKVFDYKIFYSVTFLDSLNGWIGGDQGMLYGTTDGGNRWFQAVVESSIVSNRPVKKIRFWNSQFGIAVGGTQEFAASIRRTTNGGLSWSILRTGSDEMNDFRFIDSLHIVAVGGGQDEGAIIGLSGDAGVSWTMNLARIFGIGEAISFRTSNEAFIPLYNSPLYLHTLDSGKTWQDFISPDGKVLSNVMFTDDRHGFMIGDSGSFYKYNPPCRINVQQSWNLVSVPVSIADPQKSTLFPTAISDAFMYSQQGYTATDTLSNNFGYWMKFPSDQTIEIGGFPRENDSMSVRSGWNIIGGLSVPEPISVITTSPSNLTLSSFFGYDNGYIISDTLLPGKGYWVKSSSAGVLYLTKPTEQGK